MSVPTTPADEIFPDWTDLINNWRAVDAEWLRDRAVQVFTDAAERTSVLGGSNGRFSFLTSTDSLEFRKTSGGAWESVRYPNLAVTSDATTVSLRRTGAGSGLILKADGSTEIASLVTGSGGLGAAVSASGISLKVGSKTVVLATDTAGLTVDSPIKATGDIEATAALKGASAAITGAVAAASANVSGAVAAGSLNVTGTATVGLLNVGLAEVAIDTSLAVFRHKSSAANRLSFNSTGAAVLTATALAVNGATSFANKTTHAGGADLVGNGSSLLTGAGQTSCFIAGVVASTAAPSGTYPNGTIWIQY